MYRKIVVLVPLFILWIICVDVSSAEVKVGLIYDVRGRGDLSFCDAAYAGAKKASEKWDIKLKEVNPGQSTDTEMALRGLAKLKYDIIVGVGFLFREPMNRVAGDYPDVNFVLIDAVADPSNVASLIYKAHEGTFLAGVIASMKTKTNKIGFIGGMKIPLVEAFEIGYESGINATKPEIKFYANYVGVTPNAFNDPAKAKELALSQYSKGVDIILAAAGASGLGVLEAAKETKKYIIWVDSNGNSLAPGQVLTSIIKGVELSVFESIQNVINGTFTGGIKDYGLKEGGVEYIVDDVNKDLLSKDIITKVEEFKAKIIAGNILVPNTRPNNKTDVERRK